MYGRELYNLNFLQWKYQKLSYLFNFLKNRSDYMVKNNIEIDVKVKCMEEGLTQAQLAKSRYISTVSELCN